MSEYLTVSEVAKRLGCSHRAVGRAALRHRLGIIAGGRVVAIPVESVAKIKASLHWTAGNPNWVAKERRPRRRAAVAT